MEKLRIMSVFGTRPEAIKMAPLVRELASREDIESICCVTAQHREMLDSVLEVFGLEPDWVFKYDGLLACGTMSQDLRISSLNCVYLIFIWSNEKVAYVIVSPKVCISHFP